MRGYWIAAVLAVSTAGAARANAQQTKPQGNPEVTGRLPAPASVSAAQSPGGPIRVVWSGVEGATEYKVSRSVPPTPITPVRLPSPSDTEYVDTDVRPGSTYYYEVSAVNEGGIAGLKRASAPVRAATPPPNPPVNIQAVLRDPKTITLSWAPSGPDQTYQVFSATAASPSSWVPLSGRVASGNFSDATARYPAGSKVRYRVIAQDRYGYQSEPGFSNEVIIESAPDSTRTVTTEQPPTTRVEPAVVAPGVTVRVAKSTGLGQTPSFTGAGLRKPKWVSLDPSVATVNDNGRVTGVKPGFTYIVALGTKGDGSVASVVTRVDVKK